MLSKKNPRFFLFFTSSLKFEIGNLKLKLGKPIEEIKQSH